MIISNFAPMIDIYCLTTTCCPTKGFTTSISKDTGENTTFQSFVLITRIFLSVAFVVQKLATEYYHLISSTQSFPTLTCHFYCPDNF